MPALGLNITLKQLQQQTDIVQHYPDRHWFWSPKCRSIQTNLFGPLIHAIETCTKKFC